MLKYFLKRGKNITAIDTYQGIYYILYIMRYIPKGV